MPSKQIPIGRALLWITLWTCFVSGTGAGGWLVWRHIQTIRKASPHYTITHIAQPGPLATDALAELLGLSSDIATNLYTVDLSAACRMLEQSPVIAHAAVARVPPHTLRIEYDVVRPIARCEGEGMASDGTRVPLEPHFVADSLPELIGTDRVGLRIIQATDLPIQAVDVSRTRAPSAGRREIVVHLHDAWLRLPVLGWEGALARYEKLRERVIPEYGVADDETFVVDLRLDQLAYLSRAADSDSLDHR